MQRFKILTCLTLMAVVAFLCRPAQAGRFVNLVAITVATDEGEVVVPVTPVKINIEQRPIIRAATAPVRMVKQIVCRPNGCEEKLAPAAGDCPCGPGCACDPCNCPTVAETPPPTSPTATKSPQHSILVRGPRSDVEFMQRGPVRKLLGGIFQRAKNFAVNRPKLLPRRR